MVTVNVFVTKKTKSRSSPLVKSRMTGVTDDGLKVWGGRPLYDINGFAVDIDVHVRNEIVSRGIGNDVQFKAQISFEPPRTGVFYPGPDDLSPVLYLPLPSETQERLYELLWERAKGMIRLPGDRR